MSDTKRSVYDLYERQVVGAEDALWNEYIKVQASCSHKHVKSSGGLRVCEYCGLCEVVHDESEFWLLRANPGRDIVQTCHAEALDSITGFILNSQELIVLGRDGDDKAKTACEYYATSPLIHFRDELIARETMPNRGV